MAKQFRTRKGTHIGRGHLLDFVNRQDALSVFEGTINGEQIIIGIVCDGCSGGDQELKKMSSEVGANLAATFLVREVVLLYKNGIPLSYISILLYANLIRFLRNILDQYSFSDQTDEVSYIQTHLLFTVVGFILTPTQTITFFAGDGTIVVNDEVNFIDSNNKPMYPAYQLVDKSVLSQGVTLRPGGFDTAYYKTSQINKLAIGSDAWKDEPGLINEIWGFENPSGLQRQLNIWSKKEKRFYDDVTVITIESLDTDQKQEDLDGSDN